MDYSVGDTAESSDEFDDQGATQFVETKSVRCAEICNKIVSDKLDKFETRARNSYCSLSKSCLKN